MNDLALTEAMSFSSSMFGKKRTHVLKTLIGVQSLDPDYREKPGLHNRSKHGSKYTGLAGRTMHAWNRRSDLQKGLACAGFFLPHG